MNINTLKKTCLGLFVTLTVAGSASAIETQALISDRGVIPAGGPYAPPGGLYDNEQTNGTNALASQDSSGDFTARTADDFVITESCSSGQVEITGIRVQQVIQPAAMQPTAIDLFDDNGSGTAPTAGINPIATVMQDSSTLLGPFGAFELYEVEFVPVNLTLNTNQTYWISAYGTDADANSAGFNSFFGVSEGAVGTTDNGMIIAPGAGVPDWTAVDLVIGPPELAFSFALDGQCVISEADVSVTVVSDSAGQTLDFGDPVTFTTTVSNAGPGQASNLVVVGSYPEELVYQSNSCGASDDGSNVTWNAGDLANGASTSCDTTFTVNGFGRLDYSVTANADEDDTVPGNNSGGNGVNGPARVIPTLGQYGLMLMVLGLLFVARRRFVK